jgi:hypothetical protein
LLIQETGEKEQNQFAAKLVEKFKESIWVYPSEGMEVNAIVSKMAELVDSPKRGTKEHLLRVAECAAEYLLKILEHPSN